MKLVIQGELDMAKLGAMGGLPQMQQFAKPDPNQPFPGVPFGPGRPDPFKPQLPPGAPKMLPVPPGQAPPGFDPGPLIERLLQAYPELKRQSGIRPELRQKLELLGKDNPKLNEALRQFLDKAPAQVQ